MSWYFILLVFLTGFGASALAYQVYKMTQLDAEGRGFRHPRLWRLFSLSGQNGAGILAYLIGRRKHPSVLSGADRSVMESRKRKAGIALILLALPAIGLFTVCILNG